MTSAEKLTQLKALLNISGTDQDTELTAYLNLTKAEILSYLYSGETPDDVTDVPALYEPTQIMACVAGLGTSGAEGQISHSENGIARTWKYEDMIAYVRGHVYPFARLV